MTELPSADEARREAAARAGEKVANEISRVRNEVLRAIERGAFSATVYPPVTDPRVIAALQEKRYTVKQVQTGWNETSTSVEWN